MSLTSGTVTLVRMIPGAWTVADNPEGRALLERRRQEAEDVRSNGHKGLRELAEKDEAEED